MKTWIILLLCILVQLQLSAQDQDVSRLIAALLAETPLEEDLQELCDDIGGRETGSESNARAVQWGLEKFQEIGVKTWLQEVPVPSLWLEKSTSASIKELPDFHPQVVSKYHAAHSEISAPLVYVGYGSKEDFFMRSDLKGKIALVDTELCTDINGLFAEYTQAFNAEENALQHGMVGVVFMSSRPKKLLYRFTTSKGVNNPLVQVVMAREDAKRCIRLMESGQSLTLDLKIEAERGEDFITHNVLAEIPGTDLKDEIIIIGSHIDSWALGTGANDNGCNVSLMIDIARQMHTMEIRPRRTIRFALWNGEEQGFFGSLAYTKEYEDQLAQHKMCMSVDIGSGKIIGFFMNGNSEFSTLLTELLGPVQAFGPYLNIPNAVVGTDNLDFMLQGVPNLVANHKPYNYGLNYHASSDTYDKVDLQSLKTNSAVVGAVTLGMANMTELSLKRSDREGVQAMIEEQNLEFSLRMFDLWEDWLAGRRGIAH